MAQETSSYFYGHHPLEAELSSTRMGVNISQMRKLVSEACSVIKMGDSSSAIMERWCQTQAWKQRYGQSTEGGQSFLRKTSPRWLLNLTRVLRWSWWMKVPRRITLNATSLMTQKPSWPVLKRLSLIFSDEEMRVWITWRRWVQSKTRI